jgi:hypothetical protein
MPVELLERVLTFCHAWDVAAFSQSCRLAYVLVYHSTDEYLWRELFLLHPFDDPRKSFQSAWKADPLPVSAANDWRRQLIERLNAERLCLSPGASTYEKKHALEHFIHVVREAHPIPPSGNVQPSYDLQWLERVFRRSRILDIKSEAFPDDTGQALAQLRSYIALSLDDGGDNETKFRLKVRRNQSRSFVYDLRNYNSDNSWGPYLRDGRVNWIHMEYLINVILMNLRELPGPWLHATPPLGLEATRPYSAPGYCSPELDWAGLEGKCIS